ncbi:FixH family protein [Celeribacter halophilus]|jgi:nitrogen fixation protein FixH|uniref:FixH family protein n=1 Tax=Celeribacter halophilus TaxID=576117 RepID=UPI001C089686|nr:FixH family protein [Celeribacter halophilus]MBU2891524.1 FixH family protein [Celeribacter halophilus]MDO6509682.1 FixH family protein [Celeribacter halophilus]MDO6724228.1 FixH family protein [Celeribacter halophilus]
MAREITGKHVLIGTVSAFSVIIGVNIFMAVQAVRTFPGLETANSYGVSQTFNRDKQAQEALGWTVEAVDDQENLFVYIRDAQGNPVEVAEIGGTLGRATTVTEDQTPEFTFNGEAYVAQTGVLAEGNWNYRMVAKALDGTHFTQRVVIHVKR